MQSKIRMKNQMENFSQKINDENNQHNNDINCNCKLGDQSIKWTSTPTIQFLLFLK